jgi:hypothetical protein
LQGDVISPSGANLHPDVADVLLPGFVPVHVVEGKCRAAAQREPPQPGVDLPLDRGVQEPADLASVLRPYPADAMRAFPVGPTVKDPRNDGPECLTVAG